jgi:hypothetical protein
MHFRCRLQTTHYQLWMYTVEEKIYLGVRERKRLNITAFDYVSNLKTCSPLTCILRSDVVSATTLHINMSLNVTVAEVKQVPPPPLSLSHTHTHTQVQAGPKLICPSVWVNGTKLNLHHCLHRTFQSLALFQFQKPSSHVPPSDSWQHSYYHMYRKKPTSGTEEY